MDGPIVIVPHSSIFCKMLRVIEVVKWNKGDHIKLNIIDDGLEDPAGEPVMLGLAAKCNGDTEPVVIWRDKNWRLVDKEVMTLFEMIAKPAA